MLLVLDIGNTNLVGGVFKGQKLAFDFRLPTHPLEEGRDYISGVAQQIRAAACKRCVICSVVPALTEIVVQQVSDVFKLQSLVVDTDVKTGLVLKVDAPAAVGTDRIVNAAAVRGLWGTPALVVDFGTATTFDLVDEAGVFQGGIIAPGLGIGLEALVQRTARLPSIQLEWPKSVIGKNTIAAMQSGTVLGYVCLVDGLIERVIDEFGPVRHIVATGGLGALIAAHSSRIRHYDLHLTLKGLRLIAALNGWA